MSQPTDFDIVPVAPDVDLVLFDNVLSCYPCNKDLTATYTLGEAVQQSTWDWIGLFRCEWRYLGEYVAYRWASSWPTDCTAPRRRSVLFPSSMAESTDDWRTQFQLLYVSNGNNVVGVSPHFRMAPAEFIDDFNITSLFNEIEILQPTTSGIQTAGIQKGKALKRLHDTFEIIDEFAAPAVPKKRPCAKEKITKIYRDTETLVNIPTSAPVDQSSIVQVYPSGFKFSSHQTSLQQNKMLKIFDVDWEKKLSERHHFTMCATLDSNANLQSIEYPTTLSLKTGPMAFLESVRNLQGACTSCDVARTLVSDLVFQSDNLEHKLAEMDERLKEDRRTNKEETITLLQPESEDISAWYLKNLELENRLLRQRVQQLENRAGTDTSTLEDTRDSRNEWLVWEPRRIVRLKKVLYKQQCAIEMLKKTIKNKNDQITSLNEKVKELKTLIQIADNASEKFQTLAEELNAQIKDILSKRAKDHTNEWRQFVRQFQENTPQIAPSPSTSVSSPESSSPSSSTSSEAKTSPKHHLKNKHMSKVLKCESQPKSKLHKGRAQAEQCPTCGLKFSVKADRHVIEEHIVFHTREKKLN